MEQPRLIKSNCLVQSIKKKIQNLKGKLGYGFKTNGHIFFYYELDGKRYRFYRKIYRNSNKNRLWFVGYVSIESEKEVKHIRVRRILI